MSRLSKISLPSFGRADEPPVIPVALYQRRLEAAVERMRHRGLEVLAVYGDREHSANLAYLTGFDPRFEEALLLLDADGRRKLLVGNECMGYLPDAALGIDTELFQAFSLMGQPRAASRPLRTILSEFGVRAGRPVGCAGWKCYDMPLVDGGELALDAPAYLVDLLRELAGGRERVVNAVGLFAGAEDGLRVTNEPEQIAAFEYAAGVASEGVLALMRHVQPGVREDELERQLDSRGLPLTCHPMVGFGDKVRRGLASASANRARLGDAFTTAFGVAGGLTCRAGVVAHGPQDLDGALREFFPRYAANYFDVVLAWYAALRIGASAGEVYAAAEGARDPELYRFAVNPGHYIHLDEWVHSPFAPGSAIPLRSGMALQMDIIPVSRGPFCYINAEDGVVLADAALRAALQAQYPAMWRRIEARRRFMIGALGFTLDPSVLPLGNTSGWLPPYVLELQAALVA